MHTVGSLSPYHPAGARPVENINDSSIPVASVTGGAGAYVAVTVMSSCRSTTHLVPDFAEQPDQELK